jgi:hydroxyacylglutathione hydrolase
MQDRLYFRQIQAGPMANYVYFIGDTETREALVVDPAWDVKGLLRRLDQDGMRLAGVLVTHYHPDHVGGSIFGMQIEGLPELMQAAQAPVHVNRAEAEGVRKVTGLSESDLRKHDGGDRIRVGEVEVELVHTPGHTPGSQCFLVRDRLVSGDTLFIQGCGRVDLPGGDPEQMYYTLTQRLAKIPDHVELFPGHNYAETLSSTLGQERQQNPYLRRRELSEWLALMGR